jgi:hypothetical protein
MLGKILTKGFTGGFLDLRKFLYKHHLPRTYTFNSIIQSDPNKYFYIPK